MHVLHVSSLSAGGGGLGLTPLNLNFAFPIRRSTSEHGQALNGGRVDFDVLHRQPLQDYSGSGGQCIDQFALVADGTCSHFGYLVQLG